jgi:hypothetical protein
MRSTHKVLIPETSGLVAISSTHIEGSRANPILDILNLLSLNVANAVGNYL